MKIQTIILLLLINVGLYAQPDSLLQQYTEANNKYKENKFDEAIVLYKSVLASGYEASEVYYNLGNSYFKQNEIAKSILNYERALELSPSDNDVLNNLEYANMFVKDEFNKVPDFIFDKFYSSILHLFSSDAWAIISIITFIIMLGLIVWFLFSNIILCRKTAFYLSILFLFISISSVFFSYKTKDLLTKPHSAIIMEINTIKSSPEKSGTELFIINPGVKVKIKEEYNNWFEIILPNGKIGWIKSNFIEII